MTVMIRKAHETCVIICEFDLHTGSLRDRRFKGDVEGMTRALNLGCSVLDRGIRLRYRKHIRESSFTMTRLGGGMKILKLEA